MRRDERIEAWLTRSRARVLSPETLDRAFRAHVIDEATFDFLVIDPFPLAIQLRTRGEVDLKRSKRNQRELRMRIALSELTGADVPLVLVLDGPPEQDDFERFPHVDRVLQLEHLPPLAHLEDLRVKPEVRDVLVYGAPREIQLSEPRSIRGRWATAVSLEELAYGRLKAHHPIVEHLRRHANTDALAVGGRHASSALEVAIRTATIEHLQDTLGVPLQPSRSRLGRSVLGSPVYTATVARGVLGISFTWIDPHQLAQRVRELVATAWLLRAEHRGSSLQLVLVLGFRTSSSDVLPRSSDDRFDLVRAVSELETGGWRVFPWDLRHPRLELEEYVSSVLGEANR